MSNDLEYKQLTVTCYTEQSILTGICTWYSSVKRPTRHIIGHFGDDFMGQTTNQQCHSTEGLRLVNQVEGQSHQAQLIKK